MANAFPRLNQEWLFDMHESLAIDYLLSFTCFAEVSLISAYKEKLKSESSLEFKKSDMAVDYI